MPKFEPAADLNVTLARLASRAVDRLKGDVQREARRRAPTAKRWITVHDQRVRHWHVVTNGQTIPENLRYKIQAVRYVRKGRDEHGKAINKAGGWKFLPGKYDLGRRPRDPVLPAYQAAQCRCRSVSIAGLVAAAIHSGATHIEGPGATAEIYCFFPRAAESEFGTSQDKPAHFMGGAIDAVARRLPR